MPQTWSQFTCLGDACILFKKISFGTFAKCKGQSGPSSVFILTAPVLPATFPKQGAYCGWWHKGHSAVQVGTLVSVQTIRSGITEIINRELYTVIFIGVAFQNILQKYCKVSDVSELVSSPLPQVELLWPSKPEPRQFIDGNKLHDPAS